jgi:hypothetical protein
MSAGQFRHADVNVWCSMGHWYVEVCACASRKGTATKPFEVGVVTHVGLFVYVNASLQHMHQHFSQINLQ